VVLRFVFRYPEVVGSDGHMLDPGPLADVARAAEDAGFDGIALTEHPAPSARWLAAGGHQTIDPFVALGHVAAVTSRIRLITHLAIVPYRNPSLLAKSAATVDLLSGGRLTLGLGVGYQKSEFHALGVEFADRNTLFDEALDVLPMHWSGRPFSYRGTGFSARDVVGLPRPVQDPIPIWIGGNSALSRRRAATRGTGWMPMPGAGAGVPALGTPAELADAITGMRALATAAGRVDDIDVLYPYGPDGLPDPISEAESCRKELAEYEAAGVTWIAVTGPTSDRAATLSWIEAFAGAQLVGRDAR